jgi:Zn-dependent alcohol dehydrogenase
VINATDGRSDCVIETAGSILAMDLTYAITACGDIVVPKRETPHFIHLRQHAKLPLQKLRSGLIGFNNINEASNLLAKGSVLHRVLRVPA